MENNDLEYIKAIADRVIDGKGTQKEAKKIAEWLKTPDGLTFVDEKIEKDFADDYIDGFEDLIIEKPIDSDGIYKSIEYKINRRHNTKIFWRLAAIFIPALILIGAATFLSLNFDVWGGSRYDVVEVSKGEKMMIVLPDGTNVYLNSCSQLQYPKRFGLGKRKVVLSGEAYFAVAKSNFRKFEIQTHAGKVIVYGTSFNVKSFENENLITITLDEGSISFEPNGENDEGKTKMKPNEILTYDKKSKELKIKKVSNVESYSSWTQNVVSFNNTSLVDILNELSRKFDVQFDLIDEQAKMHSFTLHREKMNLDSILNDIQNVSPIRFKNVDNNRFQVIVKK